MQYIETKSILSKLREQDTWFGITYNMNLYRGCQHGCIYCDSRSECYRVGDISQISVKRNALDLLPLELQRKRKNKATIGTGSMNDPYMPIEKDLQLTRKALQIIALHKFPVHVITKSNLVERDTDLLQDISKTYAAVSFTVTCAADSLAKKLEPNASTTSERFDALKALTDKGVYAGITLMPVLPYINDTIENIETIIRRAKDSGASYILPMFGVTLRKGSRDYFYLALENEFPTIKTKYEIAFGERYECFSPNYRELSDRFFDLCGKLGVDTKMRFYEPPVYEQPSLF